MGMPIRKLSLDEFIAWENEQAERHEYWHGEVFAMVGGRRTHGRVVANLTRQLGNRLDGSPRQVFAASMKLQIADDTLLYPDVFVTCDRDDLRTEMVFRAPTLVIEVLSPSTQAYDRSQKFALYRRLASLREYMLVDPDTRRVEGFHRNDAGDWVLHDMSDDTELRLRSLDLALPMTDVFAGLDPA